MLNLKTRMKNKTFLAACASVIVAAIYQILGLCGVTPAVSQSDAQTGFHKKYRPPFFTVYMWRRIA